MTETTKHASGPGYSPPAGCACGCGVFVWWLTDQGRYSSETPWQYYDRNKNVGAVCRDCNRDVPRTHNRVLSVNGVVDD